MSKIRIAPSRLSGSLKIPPSKSHTLRAILFAALAHGSSQIEDFLVSPDTFHMIEAIKMLGATVEIFENSLKITGFGGKPKTPDNVIECGNSGIVLRFISAIACLIPTHTILTGDFSIRHQRPMAPLLTAINQLGAGAVSSKGDGFAPIIIQGPITQQKATLDGQDSQPVSALLIAGSFGPHPIELTVTNPGEKPWIDVTVDWLKRMGVPIEVFQYCHYKILGNAKIHGFSYKVPGDFSSAAFPIAAALLTHSTLTLENIDMNDSQGDRKIIDLLKQMGAKFTLSERNMTVHADSCLTGAKIDLNDCIDALPILAVIGTFAKTPLEIYNAKIARTKESDRIAMITKELKKMGAKIEEKEDGLIVYPSNLQGAELESHHDHRLALSLSVAALGAKSPSILHGAECMAKTYHSFLNDFQSLGAQIE